jgi:DNA-binding response OmpR family regulator
MDTRDTLVLFADRDPDWSLPLRKRLAERGYQVETVSTARDLLNSVRRRPPDLVVLGDRLDDLGGRLLSGLLQERSPATRIIRAFSAVASRSADEPGPADNVLCSVSRKSPTADLVGVVTRVLSCAPRGTQPTRAPLIVCVDDDELFLKGLARVIRRQGYRVLTYADPELALEELPLIKPDLVILDVLMPGLSGFEVLGELRRFHPSSLPVVLLSALDGDAQIAEGRQRGARSYLTKPCPPELLLDTVRRLLAAPSFGTDARVAGRTGRSM